MKHSAAFVTLLLLVDPACSAGPVAPSAPTVGVTGRSAPTAPPEPASVATLEPHTIALVAEGIFLDGRAVCTAVATLVTGYTKGCAPSVSHIDKLEPLLRGAIDEEAIAKSDAGGRPWRLEASPDLPLVAFEQALMTLYRTSLSTFTLACGGKERLVTNLRAPSIVVFHFRENGAFRAGIEQGTFKLGPSCPPIFVANSDAFERCIAEIKRENPSVSLDVNALPNLSSTEKRTVSFLWSIMQRIDGDLRVAILQ